MPGTRPASRIEAFDVLAPAGTAKATPLEVATGWNPGELVGLLLDIPDGHAGLTGIAIALAHQPVIPRTQGAFIVGNDDHIDLDLIGYPTTGAWSCFVYNTDAIDHTFHVRYLVADFAFVPSMTVPAPPLSPLIA